MRLTLSTKQSAQLGCPVKRQSTPEVSESSGTIKKKKRFRLQSPTEVLVKTPVRCCVGAVHRRAPCSLLQYHSVRYFFHWIVNEQMSHIYPVVRAQIAHFTFAVRSVFFILRCRRSFDSFQTFAILSISNANAHYNKYKFRFLLRQLVTTCK